MSPRPGDSLPELLDDLEAIAGRIGSGSVADQDDAETNKMLQDTLLRVVEALKTQNRRRLGRAAQQLDDEEKLVSLVRRVKRAANVRERHELEAETVSGHSLTPPESDKVEAFLKKHPNAGRPVVVAQTGISDWRVRRYLTWRESQTGEASAEDEQVAGGRPARHESPA